MARIADPGGEGRRCFLRVYADSARKAADAQDQLRAAGYVASPLAGLPVSIKDLFDVAGERTLAGSKALDDRPPATRDAPIVARLRAAGAVLIGRTNMTEFAFSGVGINPHYGTPGNPFDRQRIPGGSSSGAPISVMDGFAVVAIGTDTGGSVRIPAALCGTVGFKPTQKRVPRDGAVPLSTTLDSIGPAWPQRRLLRGYRCRAGGRADDAAAAHPARGAAPGRAAYACCSMISSRPWRPPSSALAPRCRVPAPASSIYRWPSSATTARSTPRAASRRPRPMPGMPR